MKLLIETQGSIEKWHNQQLRCDAGAYVLSRNSLTHVHDVSVLLVSGLDAST